MQKNKVIVEDVNGEVTVRCPYMPEHIMHVDSLLTHLIRCPAKNKHDFKQCSYNPMHVVKKGQIEQHEKKCQDYLKFVEKRAKNGFNDDDDWGTPEDPDLIAFDYSAYIRHINREVQPETYVGERHNTDIFLKWKAEMQKKYQPSSKNPQQQKKVQRTDTSKKNQPKRQNLQQKTSNNFNKEKEILKPIIQCKGQPEQEINASHSLRSDASYVLGKNAPNSLLHAPSFSKSQPSISMLKGEDTYIFEEDNNRFIRNPRMVSQVDFQTEDSSFCDTFDRIWESRSNMDKSVSDGWEQEEGVDVLGELLDSQLDFLQKARSHERSRVFRKKSRA